MREKFIIKDTDHIGDIFEQWYSRVKLRRRKKYQGGALDFFLINQLLIIIEIPII